MGQTKKPWVRDAILSAALRLFRRHGYQDTTLAEIAREARVSSANLYVYFDSKLAILYAVYEPLMRSRLSALEARVSAIEAPIDRLRLILTALWKEIPAEDGGFVNNVMQALSTAGPDTRYDPALLDWMEARIAAMVSSALPPSRRRAVDDARIAHLLVMALDGYSIHQHINPRGVVADATIDATARMLLGESLTSASRARAPVRRVVR